MYGGLWASTLLTGKHYIVATKIPSRITTKDIHIRSYDSYNSDLNASLIRHYIHNDNTDSLNLSMLII
jgi:hypothetical protein